MRNGAAHLGDGQILQQSFGVVTGDVENSEVGEVDHAHRFAHFKLLGVGDFPKMPGVPFVFPNRNAVTVFRQQSGLVGGVAVGPFPTGGFHEVGPQLYLAQIEGAGSHLATGHVGLAGMHRRRVDFLGGFVAAVVHVVRGFLQRIVAGDVDAVGVHFRRTMGHPVRQDFACTGAVLDPDRLTEPQVAHFRGFPHQ